MLELRQLAPQMAEYDAWGARMAWRPYIMFFQPPDLRTASCNTDSLGFRFSADAAGQTLRVDQSSERACSLIFGNSVAFSVGASSDARSLSARLSHYGGDNWLNFSGRAFSASQEFLTFLYFRKYVGTVKRVVLFTGSNDLYLYYSPKMFDPSFGIFFFSGVFDERMNAPQNLRWPQRVLQAATPTRFKKRVAAANAGSLDAVIAQRKERRDDAIKAISSVLEQWRAMASHLGIELVYALQPIRNWVLKPETPEEAALKAAQSTDPSSWNAILAKVMDDDHYRWFSSRLAEECQRNRIRFLDMNALLSRHPRNSEWLFIDHLHMTDAGYDVCAGILQDSLNGAHL